MPANPSQKAVKNLNTKAEQPCDDKGRFAPKSASSAKYPQGPAQGPSKGPPSVGPQETTTLQAHGTSQAQESVEGLAPANLPGTFPEADDPADQGVDFDFETPLGQSAEAYESNLLEESSSSVEDDVNVKQEPTQSGGRHAPHNSQATASALLQMNHLAQVLADHAIRNQNMMEVLANMIIRNEKLLEELSMRATAPHVSFKLEDFHNVSSVGSRQALETPKTERSIYRTPAIHPVPEKSLETLNPHAPVSPSIPLKQEPPKVLHSPVASFRLPEDSPMRIVPQAQEPEHHLLSVAGPSREDNAPAASAQTVAVEARAELHTPAHGQVCKIGVPTSS